MAQGPGDIPAIDYLVNLGVAVVGASVRFAREWQVNFTEWDRKRILIEAFIAATLAGFSGLLTFWILRSWGVDAFYTAFAVGIMGHAGPEGLSLLREALFNFVKNRASTPPK